MLAAEVLITYYKTHLDKGDPLEAQKLQKLNIPERIIIILLLGA